MQTLTCSHCCESGYAKDGYFQLDGRGEGFWCETCDGYSYLDKETPKHRFTLILETKDRNTRPAQKPAVKFRKQLSPYRYPGGKSKVIDALYPHMQKAKSKRLVSPFTGGGSFELAMLDARIVETVHLNDLDIGVYSLWSILKDDPTELIRRIRSANPNHADYFQAQGQIKANYAGLSTLDAAWASLLVNRLAYSGVTKANPLGGRHGTSENLLSRWKPEALIKRIEHIHDMRDRITVTCQDAVSLIEEAYWDNDATLFIDPPYVAKGKDLYHCYYGRDDHVRLAVLLDSLHHGMPGADILVTYDYHQWLETLYETPVVEQLDRTYSA